MDQVSGRCAFGHGKWRCSRYAAFALALVMQLSLHAAGEPLEYQLKAAFLLNFTKFVEWPPSAFDATDSPIAICVLGSDPFGNSLDQIVAEEVVGGRRVIVRRIKRTPQGKLCQALFVSVPGKELPGILSGLGPGVLTIGEGESFVRDGGMIAFVVENHRVRFGINETAAETAGLKLSSKLLSVARSVEK
jgi:YfiR/HmsC-like